MQYLIWQILSRLNSAKKWAAAGQRIRRSVNGNPVPLDQGKGGKAALTPTRAYITQSIPSGGLAISMAVQQRVEQPVVTDVSTVTGLLFGSVVLAQFARASYMMGRYTVLKVGDKIWRYFQKRNAAGEDDQAAEGDLHGGSAPEHG
ncbi:hypothetical protein ACTD5D_41225 [Nocardia takedensis]|uniref:hypothetical protein n=1 Tax=Nocardia takedensis TaxID=259390 RepID=UPI003F76A185